MIVCPSDCSPGDPRRREAVGATRKEGVQRPGLRAFGAGLACIKEEMGLGMGASTGGGLTLETHQKQPSLRGVLIASLPHFGVILFSLHWSSLT